MLDHGRQVTAAVPSSRVMRTGCSAGRTLVPRHFGALDPCQLPNRHRQPRHNSALRAVAPAGAPQRLFYRFATALKHSESRKM